MAQVNGDIFLRSIGVQLVLVMFKSTSARMGDLDLAANSILFQMSFFMVYGLDGFANAAEALAGRAVGAKDREQFHQAVKATTRWASIFAILFSFAFFVGGKHIISMMTSIAEVQTLAY